MRLENSNNICVIILINILFTFQWFEPTQTRAILVLYKALETVPLQKTSRDDIKIRNIRRNLICFVFEFLLIFSLEQRCEIR